MKGIFELKWQYNVKPTLGISSSKFIVFKIKRKKSEYPIFTYKYKYEY